MNFKKKLFYTMILALGVSTFFGAPVLLAQGGESVKIPVSQSNTPKSLPDVSTLYTDGYTEDLYNEMKVSRAKFGSSLFGTTWDTKEVVDPSMKNFSWKQPSDFPEFAQEKVRPLLNLAVAALVSVLHADANSISPMGEEEKYGFVREVIGFGQDTAILSPSYEEAVAKIALNSVGAIDLINIAAGMERKDTSTPQKLYQEVDQALKKWRADEDKGISLEPMANGLRIVKNAIISEELSLKQAVAESRFSTGTRGMMQGLIKRLPELLAEYCADTLDGLRGEDRAKQRRSCAITHMLTNG